MNNPFRQRIGIWYKDSDWRDEMFSLIVSVIPEEAIARVHNSKYEKYINLKDGSFIKFVSANDCSRGNAFSKSFMQDGIPFEMYQTIIEPCTKPIFQESIVVKEFRDFVFWRKADEFYWLNKIEKEK